MDPLTMYAIGAGVSGAANLVGSWFGSSAANENSDKNLEATRETNAQNLQIYKDNKQYQYDMANSAHQRQVADLKAAGLNPVLSAGGPGAMSPNPSAPSLSAPRSERVSALGNMLGAGSGTALQAMQTVKQLENQDAQIAATKAAALASTAQSENSLASAKATELGLPQIQARNLSANQEAHARITEAGIRQQTADSEIGSTLSENRLRQKTADIDRKMVKYDAVTGRILQGLGGVTNAVGALRGAQLIKNNSNDQIIKHETHLRNQGIKGTRSK